MLKKFTVAVEETIVQEFEVIASDSKEAINIAADKYHSGEFVLSPGEVQFKQIAVVKPEEDMTEWSKF